MSINKNKQLLVIEHKKPGGGGLGIRKFKIIFKKFILK
jgi:hypothetical protein